MDFPGFVTAHSQGRGSPDRLGESGGLFGLISTHHILPLQSNAMLQPTKQQRRYVGLFVVFVHPMNIRVSLKPQNKQGPKTAFHSNVSRW
jgi:hypothetical protein